MEYIQPVGAQGPANAFGNDYVDKNAGLGIAGSFLAADVPEHVQIEILNAIVGAGLTPSGSVLKQLAYAIQKGMNYAVATGSANAWVVALPLAPLAYAAGLPFDVIAPATNTATSVTANVNALGTKAIKKRDGTDPAIGDLVGGVLYRGVYDGTNIRILTPLNSDIAAPQLDYFEMKTTGTQSVPNTTITEVNDLAVVQSQASDAVFSAGGKITIGAKTAGVWTYSQGYIPGQSGGAATVTQAYLFKNGVSAGHRTDPATFCANAGCVRVVAGDVLSMAVYQNSGGARPNRWASANPPDSYFNLYRISK